MPEMVRIEQAFCRSGDWRWFARHLVLPWALQGEQLNGDVLEIGSGSGAMAAEVLRNFPEVHLTATDYDTSMVTADLGRLEEFGSRATARQADATELPFADATFDYVLSFIMLHHVFDWEHALRESARVLRPGGQLIGYDLLSTLPLRAFHRLVVAAPIALRGPDFHPSRLSKSRRLRSPSRAKGVAARIRGCDATARRVRN